MTPPEPGPFTPTVVHMTRDSSAIVTWVEDGIVDLLGWSPAELVNLPSTRLIHPEDHASAVAAWFEMISTPDTVGAWRGRYQTKDGQWVWVETSNHNRLHDPDNPAVTTSMSRGAGRQVSVAETLRVREQMLNRLSDAIPAGLFQFDRELRVNFTNQRLHSILGTAEVSSIEELFVGVGGADRAVLTQSLADCLGHRAVEDVEIALQEGSRSATEHPRGGEADGELVCLLALRALTDQHGHVTGGIGCLSDVTERAQLRRSLERRANTDSLTGCLSRSAVFTALAEALSSPECETAVVYIDLDGFKEVNDRLGHAGGDHMLRVISARLASAARAGDVVGRIGGDEFLVVCPDVPDAASALAIACRLAEVVHEPVRLDADMFHMRVSAGVAWTATSIDPEVLTSRADQAMYENKKTRSQAATLWVEQVPSVSPGPGSGH